MTIDPKAAELAKALADAVAAQQTEEYQALAEAAKRKAEIDSAAEKAAYRLKEHYMPLRAGNIKPADPSRWPSHAPKYPASTMGAHSIAPAVFGADESIFDTPSEPERYELPEDETATAKPNGGLSD